LGLGLLRLLDAVAHGLEPQSREIIIGLDLLLLALVLPHSQTLHRVEGDILMRGDDLVGFEILETSL